MRWLMNMRMSGFAFRGAVVGCSLGGFASLLAYLLTHVR
jgi:hypothetical protein